MRFKLFGFFFSLFSLSLVPAIKMAIKLLFFFFTICYIPFFQLAARVQKIIGLESHFTFGQKRPIWLSIKLNLGRFYFIFSLPYHIPCVPPNFNDGFQIFMFLFPIVFDVVTGVLNTYMRLWRLLKKIIILYLNVDNLVVFCIFF